VSHRIAIVDDEPAVRALLDAILASRGWTVEGYASVAEALVGLTEKQAPDLMIVDIQLPDGCGLDLIGQVRDRTGRAVPAIVLSGLRDERDMTRGFAAGAIDFIGKPFRREELLARCGLHLARSAPPTDSIGSGESLTVARVAADLQLPTVAGRVFGRYEPVRELGRGGQGCVLLARDSARGGALVALKVLEVDHEEVALHRARFVRETYALSRVKHPGVVEIHDVGDFQGRLYYAMEHVEGCSLRDRALERPLDAAEATALARGLLAGLGALEAAKVLHRDLKPANIVLRGGRVDQPVIIDFGLARGHKDRAITRPDIILGTPGYLAPEVVQGSDPDLRSDLFSLGITLRFAMTGEDLYPHLHGLGLIEAMARREVPLPETTPDLAALLRGLVELDPRRRCASAAAGLALLELRPLDQQVGPAPRGRAPQPTPPSDTPWWRDVAVALGLRASTTADTVARTGPEAC
jgi:CheY-like chemotaxis protein